MLDGGEKHKLMEDVAKVVIEGTDISVIALNGDRRIVENAELAVADLMRHEIVLKPRKR